MTYYKYITFWINNDLPHPEKCKTKNIILMPIILEYKLNFPLTTIELKNIYKIFKTKFPNISNAHCQNISWNGYKQ